MDPSKEERPNRFLFTVESLDAIASDPEREREFSDEETPALKLRVTPSGSKSLGMVYRSPVDQERRRITFGKFTGRSKVDRRRTLKDARRRHAEARVLLRAKRDPALEAKLEREKQRLELDRIRQETAESERTVKWVAQEFLDSNDCPPRSWDETRRALERDWLRDNDDVEAIGPRPISEIRTPDLMPRINQLRAAGKDGAAREAKKHISRLFSYALRMGYVAGNPVSVIQLKGLRKSRARALSQQELGAAWTAAESMQEPWRQVFRILMLTALRKNELLEARWSEVSPCGQWLDIPDSRMKMRRPIRVALCDIVQSELQTLHRISRPDSYIFTCRPDKNTPARGVYKPRDQWCAEIDQILEVTGTTFRLHDLRHTAKTHLTRLKVPDDVSEAILGHEKQGMRAIYDHYPYQDECRDALEEYSRYVVGLAQQLDQLAVGVATGVRPMLRTRHPRVPTPTRQIRNSAGNLLRRIRVE